MNRTPDFVPLHCHSAFSLLDGASDPQALVKRAAELGLPALALTDADSVTGVVSFSRRCRKAGIKPLGGCDVRVEGLGRLTLLCDGPLGWASLCRLLTVAGLRDVKREHLRGEGLRVSLEDLEAHHEGLVCLSGPFPAGRVPALLRRGQYGPAEAFARRCLGLFGPGNYFLEVTRTLREGEDHVSESFFELADHLGVPAIATNPVRHAVKAGLPAYEALCRIRLGLAPDEQSPALPFNGEGYLKSAEQMHCLFADRPDALANAVHLAERLDEPLDPAARHLPRFSHLEAGESAFSLLARLTWQGAAHCYEKRLNETVRTRLVHELETIHELGFCDYFLVCWDVCRRARELGIRHALRGSAVGSAVAHCLGMSAHDPIARRVSFERFLSRARAKPPDIDIDFRHDRRDELMQYVRDAYGRDRVANVSNYVTYRAKSLLRDLGKALGFDTADMDRLREMLGWSRGNGLAEEIARTPELRALNIPLDQYADLFALCAQLSGLPRHLGTHSSGIVISDVPLCEVAPLYWAAKGVETVSLDKEDVEAEGIGLLKMDQLALRALTAIDIAVGDLTAADPTFDYEGRDREDKDTLAMIRAAQTVTAFQLESPAQMALQWRLRPTQFDDLVASVALIRPGPILGGSVDTYVRRRLGWEKVTYPLPELEPILKDTYGRIIFQDQVLDVVRVVGGLTERQADAFRRALTHARSEDEMTRLGLKLYERAKAKGLSGKAFETVWRQCKGFVKYGFPHGHALAFADHAQGTSWLLRHHPAEFLAAVLSVEPCGFWPISTVAAEAQRRGVGVRAPCINRSDPLRWRVEQQCEDKAIRCSLAFVREIKGGAALIAQEREERGPFTSLVDFCRRCPFLSREQLEWLALAGALDELCPSRREALWSFPALHAPRTSAQAGGQGTFALDVPPLLPRGLAEFSFPERYRRQWQALGFSPEGHPMQFLREALVEAQVLTCAELQGAKDGAKVAVAGLVLCPHRPPTAGGTVFFTLEDETGLAHVTVSPEAYQTTGTDIYSQPHLVVQGTADRRGKGMTLRAERTQKS